MVYTCNIKYTYVGINEYFLNLFFEIENCFRLFIFGLHYRCICLQNESLPAIAICLCKMLMILIITLWIENKKTDLRNSFVATRVKMRLKDLLTVLLETKA